MSTVHNIAEVYPTLTVLRMTYQQALPHLCMPC